MCGPFKGLKGILRLLEIILSALTWVIVLCRGPMASPWGVWCLFVWFFCTAVPAALTLVEALSLQVLLAAFLPDWADLVCGLTLLCAAMVASATAVFAAVFAAVFVCLSCVVNILCFLTSLAATGAFAVDGAVRLKARPVGYGPYACAGCSLVDVNVVTVGAAVNVVLCIVDLVLSIKSR